MPAKPAYIRATFTERQDMFELMKEHLTKEKQSDFYTYEPGWTDERIAKAVNPNFTAQHAMSVRIEKFGKRRPWAKKEPANDDTLEARVKKLEQIVDKLQSNARFQPRMI